MNAGVEVRQIVKRYDGRLAVDHLSFSLEKGKIYGFLGPNGAGKSTTMNIMTGYLAPDEGSVTIDGFNLGRQPEQAKARIGYLPEIPPLYPDMTVREYLRFAAELKGVPKRLRRDRIARVMKQTMIGDYADRLIRGMSKGYRQRVGLAQALVGDPEIVILDEPTVGLDPQQIVEIRRLVRSLREGRVVILSSHILSEIEEVCDEAMILSHGRLLAQGTIAALEARFAARGPLHIRVLGEKTAAEAALARLPGVLHMTLCAAEETPAVDATVETDHRPETLLAISRALCDASLPVLHMREETRTLEDAFLQATLEAPGDGRRPE